MRIALIDPGGLNKGLNVGLGLLAACLKKNGHQVKVVDLNNNTYEFKRRILAVRNFDRIGISIKSFTLTSASQIAILLGRKDIICGGPHVSLDGENLLREQECFAIGVLYCCVGKISGRKMRFRNLDNVIREIERAKSLYGSQAFHILDDNFTVNITRAKEFCILLIKNRIDMRWTCPNGIRADCLDEELVSLMKRSGCIHVSIGIESLDEEVFASIKKGESLEDIKKAVILFDKYRIKVHGFFLIGLPMDSLAKSLRSLEEARKLRLCVGLWNIFVPYPGTEVWDTINSSAKLIRDWKKGFHFGPHPKVTFETVKFSERQKIFVYMVTNIQSRNYAAFFDQETSVLRNLLAIFILILRYDICHIFGHFYYLATNLIGARRYLRTNAKGIILL